MRPDERDAAYIWDMLDSAKTLRDFVTDVTFYDYRPGQETAVGG
jgi:hypothetical protein